VIAPAPIVAIIALPPDSARKLLTPALKALRLLLLNDRDCRAYLLMLPPLAQKEGYKAPPGLVVPAALAARRGARRPRLFTNEAAAQEGRGWVVETTDMDKDLSTCPTLLDSLVNLLRRWCSGIDPVVELVLDILDLVLWQGSQNAVQDVPRRLRGLLASESLPLILGRGDRPISCRTLALRVLRHLVADAATLPNLAKVP
jgi:hypothetical protein